MKIPLYYRPKRHRKKNRGSENMKKLIASCLSVLVMSTACTNEVSVKKAPEAAKTGSPVPAKPASSVTTISPELLPDVSANISAQEKSSFDKFVQGQDLFKILPNTEPERFFTRFTGDGSPAFLTSDGIPALNKGLTSDGIPALSTKAEGDSAFENYVWTRKESRMLLDYFQLTSTLDTSYGFTDFGRYSQISEYNIKVDGAAKNEKTVTLFKSMGFGFLKSGDSYKLQSVTPIQISKTDFQKVANQFVAVSFITKDKELTLFGGRKLIPLPGLSVKKQIGSRTFRVEVEVISQQNGYKGIPAVFMTFKGRIYELYRVINALYAANVELPEFTSPDMLTFEVIDRDTLLKKDNDYNGVTLMIPVTE